MDVLSEDFDPITALYCHDLSVIKNILPAAPVLDNVEVFTAKYYKKSSKHEKSNKRSSNTEQIFPTSANSEKDICFSQRKFTAEQMPIQGKSREFNNVLKFMKKQADKGGPMSILQNCIDTGRRIRIYIRGMQMILREILFLCLPTDL